MPLRDMTRSGSTLLDVISWGGCVSIYNTKRPGAPPTNNLIRLHKYRNHNEIIILRVSNDQFGKISKFPVKVT